MAPLCKGGSREAGGGLCFYCTDNPSASLTLGTSLYTREATHTSNSLVGDGAPDVPLWNLDKTFGFSLPQSRVRSTAPSSEGAKMKTQILL